jgi:hypothetical protein
MFFYVPRQQVVLNYGNSPRRYNTVYAKNLKLHRGVDNRIQFQLISQEQKPIDITGKEITFRLIAADRKSILLQKALVSVLPITGIVELQVHANEIQHIKPQLCSYSLEIPVNEFDLPVFVDADSGARGVIEVVDSVLPKFTSSFQVTIPDHGASPYYSSVLINAGNKTLTVQSYMTDFTGNVRIQGSTIPDTDWYDIGPIHTYDNSSSCDSYNIEGFHPYLRVQINSESGSIDKILVR